MNDLEIPLGLSMALAHNPEAMQRFSMLSDEQKREVIKRTHGIHSKAEMRSFASDIGNTDQKH